MPMVIKRLGMRCDTQMTTLQMNPMGRRRAKADQTPAGTCQLTVLRSPRCLLACGAWDAWQPVGTGNGSNYTSKSDVLRQKVSVIGVNAWAMAEAFMW